MYVHIHITIMYIYADVLISLESDTDQLGFHPGRIVGPTGRLKKTTSEVG